MTSETERRFRNDLLEWGRKNRREYSWREPDRTLYEVFVAEFFLTQTPADNVETVYSEFLGQFPSLDEIVEASEDELAEAIEPLGFQNMRASALKQIASSHDHLPTEPELLMELPRVGRYVANATLCFARGDRLPVLDRNVERVYSRVFRDTWPESEAEQFAFTERLVPDEARAYNLALLDFGALICQTEPLCEQCFANEYCIYFRELEE
ncbi:A/G-specific DNA glycosylase [Halovivax ruber XH-70]|uniref:A/G-specific DNA glycosylase n=1 Tax=Halovivax ruber (strain DSM 18193 / JCM 13892 / XH-70) TaxID=797302 RepID=L0IH65_HALRX|nr:A/G-specific adenine glycosylase [Halovivax ruber]AGB17586.1 A/G-specific DNA glycosylase [Halovivax ruber XH-70]